MEFNNKKLSKKKNKKKNSEKLKIKTDLMKKITTTIYSGSKK